MVLIRASLPMSHSQAKCDIFKPDKGWLRVVVAALPPYYAGLFGTMRNHGDIMRKARSLAIILGLAGLALAAAPAAQAFTFSAPADDTAGAKSGLQSDLPQYTDPSRKHDVPTASGNTFQFGNGGTVTVGPQRSFNNDFYDTRDRMLSPFARDGR